MAVSTFDPLALKTRKRRLTGSIKVMLFACTGVLSILVVTAFSWDATQAWHSFHAARQIQAFDKGANMFVAGLFEVLLERLYTNNGLQAAGPADQALLKEIEARRKLVQERFRPGLAELAARDFPDKPALTAALDTALSKAGQYRSQADKALGLPRDQRDATLVKTFIAVITDSVNASLNLWFSALHRAAEDDPALARLATIKEIGWKMRDYSGRERSNISQAIASGQPVPAALLVQNTAHRARVELLWQQLENLTRDKATHPAIRQAMDSARDQYFSAFLRLNDDLKQRGDDGGKYGTTPSDYVAVTTPQIGALLNVMYAAGTASEGYADQRAADARMTFVIMASLAVFGLLTSIGTVVVITRRVAMPLTTMTTVMSRLAENDTSVEVPALDRLDEVGAMARSVQVFKDNMIDNNRLTAEKAID